MCLHASIINITHQLRLLHLLTSLGISSTPSVSSKCTVYLLC